MTPITEEEIVAAQSPKGGLTAKTLAMWGVPWPPPKGWKDTILAHGIPYQPELNTFGKPEALVTEDALQRMMDAVEDELAPAALLAKVVGAVINNGHAEILWEFPEVLAFFGARIPAREEVAHLHNVDERMFEAADRWPNREAVS